MEESELLKKDYEISFLLKNEADHSALEKTLSEAGVSISYQEPLKEIRLTYPIKKHSSAYFGFDYFSADPAVIKGVSDTLTLKPEVLRFIIITPPVLRKIKEGQGLKAEPQIIEPQPSFLSNEALEQKLEEILK